MAFTDKTTHFVVRTYGSVLDLDILVAKIFKL